jgi:hypothetical protein
VYIIGELIRSSLADEKPHEPQLDTLLQHSFILASFGIKLSESLVAVALPLSLPPSYNAIRPILTKSTDKCTPSAAKDTKLKSKRTTHSASPAVDLHTRVGARKCKKTGNGSSNSRNSELKKKCTYRCKPIHEEYEHRKKKADETAAIEKKQNNAKPTAASTAKAARAETISESAPSSHNEERI